MSAYALDSMRESAPFDILGVIEPGVLATLYLDTPKDASILILATKATVASKAYETPLLQNSYTNITSIASGLFVPIVEEDLVKTPILHTTMQHYFKELKTPSIIILGCTHFPLIANELHHYFEGKTKLVHSGDAIMVYLKQHYDLITSYNQTPIRYFASQNPSELKATAKKWLNQN